MNDPATTIECHDNAVPEFVETALERLYGCIHSSLVHFRHYGGIEGASTYVARRGDEVLAILLFRIDAGRLRILNEGILLPPQEMARFCDYVFRRYGSVSLIAFHAIRSVPGTLPYPCQRVNFTEDSVIDLTALSTEFLSCLSNATRKKLRYYHKRLCRDFPSFAFDTQVGDGIDERDVRDIIGFNRRRMLARKRVSAIVEDDIGRIIGMARTCGIVGACRIDGRICAGGIVYRCGDDFYSLIQAHDPDFDPYRLGMLLNCLFIQHLRLRNGREYHLLWGREPYKALLQGVLRDLDDIHVFRSRAAAVRHAGLIVRSACFGCKRRLKIWALQDSPAPDSAPAKLKSALLALLRRTKRHVPGPA